VTTLVAQTPKQVIGQQSVAEGDQVDAKLQLLKTVPLEGKLVTLDAGLLRREVAQTQQWKAAGGIPFGPAGFA
jgi:hypothetical protein